MDDGRAAAVLSASSVQLGSLPAVLSGRRLMVYYRHASDHNLDSTHGLNVRHMLDLLHAGYSRDGASESHQASAKTGRDVFALTPSRHPWCALHADR